MHSHTFLKLWEDGKVSTIGYSAFNANDVNNLIEISRSIIKIIKLKKAHREYTEKHLLAIHYGHISKLTIEDLEYCKNIGLMGPRHYKFILKQLLSNEIKI